MKRLITLASILAVTAAPTLVMAGGYGWTHDKEMVLGDIAGSKDAAYNLGLEMMQDYQSMTSSQLRDEFTTKARSVDRKSVSITDSSVTINEFLQSDGMVRYQPVLHLGISYLMYDD